MENHRLVRRRLNTFGLAFLLSFFTATAIFAAQLQLSPTIAVTVNKSMVFRLASKAKRVSVSQPDVADVLVVAPTQLLINGKAVGTTSLVIFDEKGEVSNYDLVVGPDVAALRAQLRSVLPGEQVEVGTSGPAIVLRGEVSNETVYDKVLSLAVTFLPPKPPATIAPTSTTIAVNPQQNRVPTSGSGFAGGGQIAFDDAPDMLSVYRFPDKAKIEGIVDMLVIREVRQIELDVIVAEVSMNKAREAGFNFNYSNSGGNGVTTASNATGNLASIVAGVAGNLGPFTYVNGAHTLVSLLRLLQNKDVSEVLAQPRLVIKNGRSGGFLSGGEFPVATTVGSGGVAQSQVEFKPFGVRLDFVPTITWSGRIDLRVFPEVSDADGPTVNGIPSLNVKRTLSRVELADGESLIIGGLLDRRISKIMNKIPGFGDIPILGALFRNTKFENRESELIFVITPRIVRTMKPGEKPLLPGIEKYDDPDMRQVPVPGGSEERKQTSRGASIP